MTQFTASEVRDAITWKYGDKSTRISAMLTAFADLLEARERAQPVVTRESAISAIAHISQHNGPGRETEARQMLVEGASSDAERLAEALREFDGAVHKELADLTRIPEDDRGRINRLFAMDCVVGLRRCWDKLSASRNANSAQAQPPAASVTDAMVDAALTRAVIASKESGIKGPTRYMMRAALKTALAAQENPNG